MKPIEEQVPYRVYVLRSWRERGAPDGAPAVWRFSLEDPHTGRRRGFADLEALMAALAQEMAGNGKHENEKSGTG